jgi:hypothetical protein
MLCPDVDLLLHIFDKTVKSSGQWAVLWDMQISRDWAELGTAVGSDSCQ